MKFMKKIVSNIFCVLLSLLSIAGGAVLFVHNFPEDLIWNLSGAVLMFTGTAAIVSKILFAVSAGKGRTA